jgi:hypothetical protein
MTVMTDKAPGSQRARAIAQLLAVTPDDVAGVVDLLKRLQPLLASGPRGAEDGVACFNVLYERITSDVLEQLAEQDLFRDPEFLARLDVEFARRYFAALRADVTGGTVPRAWKVLFERREDPATGPMEFAVCGVNAHVNFDLAPAVVRTCTVLGRRELGNAEHHDYQALNSVFALHMSRLRDHFQTWLGREIDGQFLDSLLDGASSLTVVVARDAAWRRAEHLWGLRSRPAEYDRECEAIDWRAAMIGRGVLSIGAL